MAEVIARKELPFATLEAVLHNPEVEIIIERDGENGVDPFQLSLAMPSFLDYLAARLVETADSDNDIDMMIQTWGGEDASRDFQWFLRALEEGA